MMTVKEILKSEEKMKESLLEIERSNLSDEQKVKAGELLINYPQFSVKNALGLAEKFENFSVEDIGTYLSYCNSIFSLAFENNGNDLEKCLENAVYDLAYRSVLGLNKALIIDIFETVRKTALKIKHGEATPENRRKAEAICNHLEFYSADYIQDLINRICPNIDAYNNITLDAYRNQLSDEVWDYFENDFNPTDDELVRHAYEVYVEYLEILDDEGFCSMVGIDLEELDSVLSTDDNSFGSISDEAAAEVNRLINAENPNKELIAAINADLESGQFDHYNEVIDKFSVDPEDPYAYDYIDWVRRDVEVIRLAIEVYCQLLDYNEVEFAQDLGFVDEWDDGDVDKLNRYLNEREKIECILGPTWI